VSLDDASRLLIVLAGCDWVFTAVIYIGSRRIPSGALTERAAVSVILSTIATIVAIMGAAYLLHVPIAGDVSTFLLVLVFILVSAPQFLWAAGLALGKFR
jgi:cytochrome c oxidase assembly factor CtaG